MIDAEARADEAAARVLREEALDMVPQRGTPAPWDKIPQNAKDAWLAVLRRALAVRERALADDAKVTK